MAVCPVSPCFMDRHRCPICHANLRKVGQPQRLGAFEDQIIVCTACDWSGVDSKITEGAAVTQMEFDLWLTAPQP